MRPLWDFQSVVILLSPRLSTDGCTLDHWSELQSRRARILRREWTLFNTPLIPFLTSSLSQGFLIFGAALSISPETSY